MPYLRNSALRLLRGASSGGATQLAAAILALGACATAAVFNGVDRHYSTERNIQRTHAFQNIVEDIQNRFELYALGLRALRNFASVDTVPSLSRTSFERFVNSKNFALEFPGARGIGVIRYVKPEERAQFLLEKRIVDGYPDFRIKQIVPHEGPNFVIQYVSPRNANIEAIGLDVSSEQRRKQAALASIARNAVTLTAPIKLMQAGAKGATGLLALLPIFRNGVPHDTITERMEAIEGWAYSPLIVDEVLADIQTRYYKWHISIVDQEGDVTTPLYDTIGDMSGSSDELRKTFNLQGREWMIRGVPSASLILPGQHEKYIVALATLLLFALIALVVYYRTRHLAKEQHLTIERARLADIVEHASDAMLSSDIDGRILSWNAAASRLFELDGLAERTCHVRTLFSNEPDPIFAGIKAGRDLPEQGLTLKTLCKRSSGAEFPAMISFFALRNNTRQIGICVRDMSDQQAFEDCILQLTHKLQAEVRERTTQLDQSLALQAEIQHLAMHDPLTGLANRTLFRDRLLAAVELHAKEPDAQFALLALDLDRFKPVNDTYGHPIGDVLLTQIGERLRGCIKTNEIAARLGGDEFAILLERGTDKERAVAVAMRVLAAIEQPFNVQGLKLEIGVSIGIALHDTSMRDVDADSIFKLADHALYTVKHNGRRGYHMCTDMEDAEGPHASRLAIEMRAALRRGEFKLLYQPMIDCATRQIEAFEALLRWEHPTRGTISPVEFIPVAEETGEITALGEWALRAACTEAAEWDNNVNISVNVSPIQIKREGWDESVIAIVEETGIDPSRLIIEVTESVLMADSDQVLARLQRLQDFGISIALDDFGTGYSSLSYLRKFRFDKLKIDKSFMRNSEDVVCAAIIRCIVRLGRQLSLQVVAEGIETEHQLKAVEREGCSHAQGYFFAKPLDAAAARAYMKRSLGFETAGRLYEPDLEFRKSA